MRCRGCQRDAALSSALRWRTWWSLLDLSGAAPDNQRCRVPIFHGVIWIDQDPNAPAREVQWAFPAEFPPGISSPA